MEGPCKYSQKEPCTPQPRAPHPQLRLQIPPESPPEYLVPLRYAVAPEQVNFYVNRGRAGRARKKSPEHLGPLARTTRIPQKTVLENQWLSHYSRQRKLPGSAGYFRWRPKFLKKGLALNCPNLFFLQQFGDFKNFKFQEEEEGARSARAARENTVFWRPFGIALCIC